MSQTNRWYVFGRKVPLADGKIVVIPPGTVYEFTGWSRTQDAAIQRRAELDRAGRAGIMVFSPSRRQAVLDIMACYDGVVVDGYVSPEDKRVGQAIVKAAVMRAIFCPYTGVVLDMRRAVVLESPRKMAVMAATYWDEREAEVRTALEKHGVAGSLKVYDGRELFKR